MLQSLEKRKHGVLQLRRIAGIEFRSTEDISSKS